MNIFASPRIIAFGPDSLEYVRTAVSNLGLKKAMIITDKVVFKIGYAEKVKQLIEEAGAKVKIFDAVEPEPDFKTAYRAIEVVKDFSPDAVVAVGGGSVIDLAKAILVKYERPDQPLEEVTPLVWMGIGERVKLIAIPTTSGTGSDVSGALVLTDRIEKRKVPLFSYEVVPYLSIVDPSLPQSMGPRLALSTGMDAITQAFNAVISTQRNDLSDALAFRAIQLILRHLPRSLEGDPLAREKLHTAASMSGLAFSNSLTTLSHALGHALGSQFNVQHGIAVALFLPYELQFVSKDQETLSRLAELGRTLGLREKDDRETFESLLRLLYDFYAEVGQPTRICDLGIERETFEAKLETLVKLTLEDPEAAFTPRFVGRTEVREMLIRAYDGRPVDF